jgi:hypothetical protein
MAQYNYVDLLVSPSGDLCTSSNLDLQLAQGSGVLKQDVAFRLRTNPGEFFPHLDVGAGLDEIIGEPNDRVTMKTGESKISRSLVYDGLVSNIDLYVRGVPLSLDSIMYYVFVNNGMVQLNVTPDVIFNMMNGLKNLPGA